jgi:hypothetical protein
MRYLWLVAVFWLALPGTTPADDKPAKKPEKKPIETFSDPDKAGPDFKIQGEYAGEAPNGNKIGSQVVALGDGAFTVMGYHGGLPGDGWDGERKLQFKASTTNGKVTFEGDAGGDKFTATIADGKLTIKSEGGGEFVLKRVERTSPTLGMKPPEGAIVLFGGESDVSKWKNGKLSPEGLLSVAGTRNIFSQHAARDFTLHVEFRLPFMPRARGQGRANSGVYLQNRYELQVLDSFGLKGENNECGGFYQAAAPKVNMCLPPLQWQTYDIEFTAARYENGKKVANAKATVKHNGVVIHDNQELKGPSPGGQKEEDSPGVIQFQDHGNPLVYRNIWLVEKK